MIKNKRPLFLMLSFFISLTSHSQNLSIISPHRKSIQTEFVPQFESYYQKKFGENIKIDWIDQGGTNNNLRFIEQKFTSGQKSSGIDLFWGGGEQAFEELARKDLLEKIQTDAFKALAPQLLGVPLKSTKDLWAATAFSSFGIFYNKKLISMLKLPTPKEWKDLTDERYLNLVSLADPRHSNTSLVMSMVILQAYGWDQGWKVLTEIAANAASFSLSSSDPIKEVVSGNVAAATAVDFYATAKIAELGEEKLGFITPEGKTAFNSDPIAIIKGAPNKIAAERFIDFILSQDMQRLLVLKAGYPGGPKTSTLGRMAIDKKAYEGLDPAAVIGLNPFVMKQPDAPIDAKLARNMQVLADMIGVFHCDAHKDLQEAWKKQLKKPSSSDLATAPITYTELEQLGKIWDNGLKRNEVINKWTKDAKERYKKALSAAS